MKLERLSEEKIAGIMKQSLVGMMVEGLSRVLGKEYSCFLMIAALEKNRHNRFVSPLAGAVTPLALVFLCGCGGGSGTATAGASNTTPGVQTSKGITKIVGMVNESATIQINGIGFGTKGTAAPAYYYKNQTNTIGQLPANLTSSSTSGGGFVSNENTRVSNKPNIKWHYIATAPTGTDTPAEMWGRDVFDFGRGITEFYGTAWVYIDQTGTTCDQWQWKYMTTGSSVAHEGYFNAGDTAFGTTIFYNQTSGWFNPGLQTYYNPWPTNNNGITPNIPPDAFLWKQWQRIEWYLKASENGTGVTYMNRIGRSSPLTNLTKVTNMGSGDLASKLWRVTGIGMAVASVSRVAGACNGEGKVVDLKLYNDDLYLDSTQARVELCDSSTWAARTQCEIQPATAWNSEQITITFNKGNFQNSQTSYLFVIDADGNPIGNSFPIKIGSQY